MQEPLKIKEIFGTKSITGSTDATLRKTQV